MKSSIFLSAGDHSGDVAASRLVDALRSRIPDLTLFGLGGERLRKQGQEQFANGDDLAVMGFWEVAKRFFYFQALLNQCAKEIETRKPDAVILVDYPGFNLRLAKRIRKTGIPIAYYITPQVWAWGKKRIPEIRELIDLPLVILPFEAPFFAEHGVKATFVGHYLLEDIPEQMISSPTPPQGHLALLPGSRKDEIRRLLPLMLHTAGEWRKETGQTSVVAGIRGKFDYETLIQPYRDAVRIEYDNTREVVHQSTAVVVASGTATLECGIIGRPMVIVYKTGRITWEIAKRLVTITSVGLVNLTLGKNVVSELLQHKATPENVIAELYRLQRNDVKQQMISELHVLPRMLGEKGASVRAADTIIALLKRKA
jgi:lipid-A-disaccharide synthase